MLTASCLRLPFESLFEAFDALSLSSICRPFTLVCQPLALVRCVFSLVCQALALVGGPVALAREVLTPVG